MLSADVVTYKRRIVAPQIEWLYKLPGTVTVPFCSNYVWYITSLLQLAEVLGVLDLEVVWF